MGVIDNVAMESAALLGGEPRGKHKARVQLYIALLAIDCLIIGMVFATLQWLSTSLGASFRGLNLGAMVMPIYAGTAINGNAYTLQALRQPGRAAAQTCMLMLFAMLAVQCVLYFSHATEHASRLYFGLGIALSAVLLACVRRPFSRYALMRTGGNLTAELLIQDGVQFTLRRDSIDPLVVDASDHGLKPDLNDPWMLHRIGSWLQTFDRVVVACPPERRHSWTILLRGASVLGEVIVAPAGSSGAIGIGSFAGYETHVVARGALDMTNRIKKRAFDLLLTIPALLFLMPLMAIVAIAIKLDSKGPVFFRQDRIGEGNRLFEILKFRSMHVDKADLSGSTSASRSDARITRVGRIIRSTSIDELPQLFNVLFGQMSIVGPRPHALGSTADAKLFWQISEYYWCRHALKPGITGLAQIRGFRGATEKTADLENRLAADLEYLKNWSLMRELFIVVRTFKVIAHKNAF